MAIIREHSIAAREILNAHWHVLFLVKGENFVRRRRDWVRAWPAWHIDHHQNEIERKPSQSTVSKSRDNRRTCGSIRETLYIILTRAPYAIIDDGAAVDADVSRSKKQSILCIKRKLGGKLPMPSPSSQRSRKVSNSNL